MFPVTLIQRGNNQTFQQMRPDLNLKRPEPAKVHDKIPTKIKIRIIQTTMLKFFLKYTENQKIGTAMHSPDGISHKEFSIYQSIMTQVKVRISFQPPHKHA